VRRNDCGSGADCGTLPLVGALVGPFVAGAEAHALASQAVIAQTRFE
jgi:hypothetical protein